MGVSPAFRAYPAAYESNFDSVMAMLTVKKYSEGPWLCVQVQWKDEDWCTEVVQSPLSISEFSCLTPDF